MLLQRMSTPDLPPLTDRFGRRHTYLRIAVVDRCNLRCAYCMPHEEMAWLPKRALLSREEIVRVARIAVTMGVRKIRVTGGEPLLRSDLPKLLADLRAIDGLERLAMTTNALLLERHLPTLAPLLDTLNISLDTLCPDRFLHLTRRNGLAPTLRALDAALDSNIPEVKLNVVVMRGVNEDEIPDFVALTATKPLAVRFIEFMPFAGNGWGEERVVPYREIIERIESNVLLEALPLEQSYISRNYVVKDRATGVPHRGTAGVIASMTLPFCAGCSRLRLTADGRIMPCLHAPLEFDLRRLLRMDCTDPEIARLLVASLDAKPREHADGATLRQQSEREMIRIGG